MAPAVLPSTASAGAPAWKLTMASLPTNFTPGSTPGEPGVFGRFPEYDIIATNVGSAPTSGPITITDTLPAGLTPIDPEGRDSGIDGIVFADFPCAVSGQTVTCTDPHPVGPGRMAQVAIPVAVAADAPAEVLNRASVFGGGSGEARATTTTEITSDPDPFGAVGLSLALTGEEAAPVTQAGSHPYQVTLDTGLSTALGQEGDLIGAEHLRDLSVDLPRGMIFDAGAAPLCTEAQLGTDSCPDASAVGFAGFQFFLLDPQVAASPLYNMVPPPGALAELAMNPLGLSSPLIHFMAGLASDGEYEISLSAHELLARHLSPVISVQAQLWGDPSDPTHDGVRGKCVFEGGSCPVPASSRPFLSMPGSCSSSLSLGVTADSWEDTARRLDYGALAENALGEPIGLDGCDKLEFAPKIEAKPTTNLADSPSGLELELRVPQSQDLARLSAANLKDATIALPEGMAINPSFAAGTGACTQAQLDRHGSEPAACPDAAKLGTVEVTTPLVDHPLSGALYLAQPYENPFGSLLAVYLTIDDPESGVVVKLAGEVDADPRSGRLVVSFKESPQLPLEELKLHLFAGPRAPLRTPATCANYTTTSVLTPWSSPEGADAHPADDFAVRIVPSGGSCPGAEARLANNPSFSAGTIAPQAGAYSPFVLKLNREDGTQPLAGIDATLPEGLIGKLAGIPYCPEAAISQAQSREKPNEGAVEQASPSCPLSSEVGTVDVAAGVGITPFHAQGHAYLAGPYKGAPLSLVVITPAIAGPFDLGAVTVRAALKVDPETTRVSAVSDPFPQILDGIPLDVRSVAVKLGRPQFTLNPTNCDPKSVLASATSSLGSIAALRSPFQVGGCSALGFKPKLAFSLKGGTKRGGHPALRATLAQPKGMRAGLSAVQVTLPSSVALDRSRIGALCGREQFRAGKCPPASAYGQVTAITPLLGQRLRGAVYLRSSGHGLPELAARLRGEGSNSPSPGISVWPTGAFAPASGRCPTHPSQSSCSRSTVGAPGSWSTGQISAEPPIAPALPSKAKTPRPMNRVRC